MFSDIGIVVLLSILVPFLINHYIPSAHFRSSVRMILLFLGLLLVWASLGLTDAIMDLIRASRADDGYHNTSGMEMALAMSIGDWGYVWDYSSLGNKAFHVWLGMFYWLTGCGLAGSEAFNGFVAFWANLMLIRHLASSLTLPKRAPTWLPLIVFVPSLVFWFTILYKEAILYWGICLFFTSMMRAETLRDFLRHGLVGLLGLAVAMTLRPYLAIIWAVAISYASVLRRGSLLQSAAAVLVLFAAFAAVQEQTSVSSSAEALEYAEDKAADYERHAAEEGYASNIDISNPIPGVVGAVSLFLRPFPWNLRAARVMLSGLEIWTITSMILIGWYFVSPSERRNLLSRNDVITSLLVCTGFCLLLSYILNEGQVIRLRIHALPALLTLAWLPLAVRLNRQVANRSGAKSIVMHSSPSIETHCGSATRCVRLSHQSASSGPSPHK